MLIIVTTTPNIPPTFRDLHRRNAIKIPRGPKIMLMLAIIIDFGFKWMKGITGEINAWKIKRLYIVVKTPASPKRMDAKVIALARSGILG
jgi:hypothetical protein